MLSAPCLQLVEQADKKLQIFIFARREKKMLWVGGVVGVLCLVVIQWGKTTNWYIVIL